jgi:hypothetical protein
MQTGVLHLMKDFSMWNFIIKMQKSLAGYVLSVPKQIFPERRFSL